jgi:hypothetical protein
METLKTYGQWKLNKYAKTKYFKNGRANLHVEITYCIEHDDLVDSDTQVATGIFWIQTKAEALKHWSELKRTHSIGGSELRADLFPTKRGA